MIKTLQAIFYITWIIVGVVLIAGVFVAITTFPFEKIGAFMGENSEAQREGIKTPSVNGPDSGPSPQMQQEGPPAIDSRTREVLKKLLGKERADQIETWADITSEEQSKMEKYFGGSPPGGSSSP